MPVTLLKPVIETCGVIIKDDKHILTFPNLKFCTDYSVPGGSVDWTLEMLNKPIEEQYAFVFKNALRELQEESGIVIISDPFPFEMGGLNIEDTIIHLKSEG